MSKHPPISQQQRSTLADMLQHRLVSLRQESGTKLEDLTQAQHAFQAQQEDLHDAPHHLGDAQVEAAVADIDSGEFNAVSQALQRIHGADYGLCIDCHAPIAFERLELEPQALRCAVCQSLYELAH